MKNLFTLLFLLNTLFSFGQINSKVTLEGLHNIDLYSSATTNAILEVDGILVFANQVQVVLKLGDKIIGRYNYKDLLKNAQLGRYEHAALYPDRSNQRIFVITPEGIGVIYYNTGKTETFSKALSAAQDIPTPIKNLDKLKENLSKDNGVLISQDTSIREEKNYYVKDSFIVLVQQDTFVKFNYPMWDVVEDRYLTSKEDGKTVLLVATKEYGLYQVKIENKSKKISESTKLNIPLRNGKMLNKARSLYYLKDFDTVIIGTIGQNTFMWSHRREEVFKGYVPTKPKRDSLDFYDNKFSHYWTICNVNESIILAGNDIGGIELINWKQRKQLDYFNIKKELIKQRKISKNEPFQIITIVADTSNANTFWVGAKSEKEGWRIKIKIDSKSRIVVKGKIENLTYKPTVFTTFKNAMLFGLEKTLIISKNDGTDTTIPDSVSFISYNKDTSGIYFGGKNSLRFLTRPDTSATSTSTPIVIFDKKSKKSISRQWSYVFEYGDNDILLTSKDGFFMTGKRKRDTIFIEEVFNQSKGLTFYTPDGGAVPMLTIYGGIPYIKKGKTLSIWLSTNYGLVAFDTQKKSILLYPQRSTGMQTPENNTNGFLSINDSTGVFATLDGLSFVDLAAAFRYANKDKPATQLWRIYENEIDSLSYDSVQNTFWVSQEQYKRVTSNDTLAYEDDEVRYYLVKPTYDFLAKAVNDIGLENEEPNLRYNGMYKAEAIYGEMVESGRNSKITIDSREYIIVRDMSDSLIARLFLVFAIISLIGVGRLLFRSYNQKKLYSLRRKLFNELGEKLEQANGYEGIQAAFQTIDEIELKNVLESTKISLYRYESFSNQLQLIGHADANPKQEEDNSKYENIRHVHFEIDKDINAPVVWHWNQEEDKMLVVNDAKDFYHNNTNGIRPDPKRGKKTESFIFHKIKIGNQPMGTISIQHEESDKFPKEKEQEFQDLIGLIGRMVGLKLEKLDSEFKRNILKANTELFRNRMEAHFFKNLIFYPLYDLQHKNIIDFDDESFKITNKIQTLVKDMFGFTEMTTIENECLLCENYIEIYSNNFFYSKGKKVTPTLKYKISQDIKDFVIPSFLIINIAHNCIQHNFEQGKIEIDVDARLDKGNLLITIKDDGQGIKREISNSSSKRSSTKIIEEFFATIKAIIGEEVTISINNITESNPEVEAPITVSKGTVVTLTISRKACNKFSQLKNTPRYD